jgi:hypothetical protein
LWQFSHETLLCRSMQNTGRLQKTGIILTMIKIETINSSHKMLRNQESHFPNRDQEDKSHRFLRINHGKPQLLFSEG